MSVVLVIAVGLFFLRDNIAKFINNAATQIAGEESSDGLNEYGFVWGQKYEAGDLGASIAFFEDGSSITYNPDGSINTQTSPGTCRYSYNTVEAGDRKNSDYIKLELQPSGKFKVTDS